MPNSQPGGDERAMQALATRLASNQDSIFIAALTEAVTYGPQGNDVGVRAMEEAMRRRSGRRDLVFLKLRWGTLANRDIRVATNAGKALEQLAKEHTLLRDPQVSQDLMMAYTGLNGHAAISECIDTAYQVGGVDGFYTFQLLFNHLQQSVQLGHARGERSYTEQAEQDE